jgi:large subunit ribosomal protein L6
MSRIGRLPIKLPAGVKVTLEPARILVEGKKGKLAQALAANVAVKLEDNLCLVSRKDDSKQSKSEHGMFRRMIQNMVTGVTEGYSKVLLVNGVGYRAELKGRSLVLNLGFSNPVEYSLPEGISVAVEANSRIIVSSIDRQQLGQVCAEIRSLRPPEPYKGKGIRYEKEFVRRKIGKTGVK